MLSTRTSHGTQMASVGPRTSSYSSDGSCAPAAPRSRNRYQFAAQSEDASPMRRARSWREPTVYLLESNVRVTRKPAPRESAPTEVMLRAARTRRAVTPSSPSTAAAMGIALSAKALRRASGLPNVRQNFSGALFSRGLHIANANRRHRLPEQG